MVFDGRKMSDPDPHHTWMRVALAQARAAAARGEVPVGAVVVKDGRAIAVGHNVRECEADPTGHAELLAMRRAARALGDWRLEGCTVYVTLEPCAMCAGAMVNARVERVVFATRDPKGGFVGSVGDLSDVPALNHAFEVIEGVGQEDASALLKDFFKALRTKKT